MWAPRLLLSYWRRWATVRRCVAMQRELDSLYLTNGHAAAPSWRDASADQILADINALAKELEQRGIGAFDPPASAPVRWTTPEGADIRKDLRAMFETPIRVRPSYFDPFEYSGSRLRKG